MKPNFLPFRPRFGPFLRMSPTHTDNAAPRTCRCRCLLRVDDRAEHGEAGEEAQRGSHRADGVAVRTSVLPGQDDHDDERDNGDEEGRETRRCMGRAGRRRRAPKRRSAATSLRDCRNTEGAFSPSCSGRHGDGPNSTLLTSWDLGLGIGILLGGLLTEHISYRFVFWTIAAIHALGALFFTITRADYLRRVGR